MNCWIRKTMFLGTINFSYSPEIKLGLSLYSSCRLIVQCRIWCSLLYPPIHPSIRCVVWILWPAAYSQPSQSIRGKHVSTRVWVHPMWVHPSASSHPFPWSSPANAPKHCRPWQTTRVVDCMSWPAAAVIGHSGTRNHCKCIDFLVLLEDEKALDGWRWFVGWMMTGEDIYFIHKYIYNQGGLSAHTPSFMPVGRPAPIRLSNAKSPSKCSAVNEQLCPHNISCHY